MREITVGVVAPAYVNVPLWVAQERGFLERRGLAATERICGTTHGVTSALRDGEVDIALTAPEGSIADAVAGGPLRVVAGLIDTPPLSMIAIPAHKPFGDLRGGRIGTSSLTEGTRHVAERMLAAHGLSYPADYDFALEGSHVERWKALQAGTIDAALQMIPYDFMAVEAGFTDLGPVTEEFALNAVCANIGAERAWLSSFLKALAEATEWFRGHVEQSVAVVGGGPVGMWLAAELHRGGVRPVVLERRAERPPYSKALTIYPRTVEQFAMRGLVDRWLAEGTPVPSSHFALLTNRLDFSFLPTRYPFTLFLPQRRTEELLEEHLAELGVPYLRRHAVTGLRQDEAGVDLDVDTPGGPAVVRAAYAVGCDGAASVVRAVAGIDFEGTPDTWRTILGDIELTDPPQAPALTLNRPGGSMYMVAIGGGRYRLAVIDHATLHDPVDKPATFAELRASALRLAGTDFGMRETRDAWLSRVGNAARQAASYRAGRVLLAGDAAHIHYPAGGQGLNLGLQDAANLAWKLAAEIRGWASPGLLDSYHAERYPVGLDVIDDSLAQCGLIANPTRDRKSTRLNSSHVSISYAVFC